MIDNVRSAALLAFLALAAGCGPGLGDDAGGSDAEMEATSSEIIGGSTEAGYPGVAMLYHDYGYLCSGTMIDDRVYLTAGHCIETLSASHYTIYGGTNLNANEPDWQRNAASVHRHPQLVLTNSNIDHDIGIVVLADDAPVKPYRWLAEDEDGIYTEGTLFEAVGYGVTGGNGGGDGIKRSVQLSIEAVYSNVFEYGGSNYNTCSGDSGGPAIAEVDGYLTVIGVVSYGDQNCEYYGADMRTDDNRAFIEGFASPNAGRVHGPSFEKKGSDNPLACSVASVEPRSPASAALLALVAFAGVIARRRG